MPKAKVVLLTEARLQLRDIAMVHKLKVGPRSAKRITDQILKSLRRLEEFPQLGVEPKSERLVAAGYRMLISGEYLCFYQIQGDTIYVSLIVHGSVDYVRWLLE